jgi:8-oxo-dGTP pyrophosphatase MutT (NUDIX family)
MIPNKPREGAGLFIISPGLDRVLVLDAGDYLDVPKGARDRGEPLLQTALRETWKECGIRLSESDLITIDSYKVGNLTMFLAMSSNKPTGKNQKLAMYVPWRTLEDSCEDFLYPAVQWAKERSYS